MIKIPEAKMGMTDKEDLLWFVEVCNQLAQQAQTKRLAYRENLSTSGKFLELLYPDGIPVAAYHEVLIIVRVFDKLCRRANEHNNPGSTKDEENPWGDVAGYGIAALYDKARGLLK